MPMVFKIIEPGEYWTLWDLHFFDGIYYSSRRYAFKRRAESLGTHFRYEWIEMVDFFGGVCCKCAREVIGSEPTKDHIIAITKGGSDSIRNIQPLCRQCNTKKGTDFTDYRIIRCAIEGRTLPEKWRIDG